MKNTTVCYNNSRKTNGLIQKKTEVNKMNNTDTMIDEDTIDPADVMTPEEIFDFHLHCVQNKTAGSEYFYDDVMNVLSVEQEHPSFPIDLRFADDVALAFRVNVLIEKFNDLIKEETSIYEEPSLYTFDHSILVKELATQIAKATLPTINKVEY